MTGFLLDTDVISMLSPSRNDASAMFLAWLERMDSEDRLFLSVVVIHEIEKGITLLESTGATTRAVRLRNWLIGLISDYEDKIIVFNGAAAAISGQLDARAIAAGYNSGLADATVAGIAKAHDLVVVTCNTRHFIPFNVGVISPDEEAKS